MRAKYIQVGLYWIAFRTWESPDELVFRPVKAIDFDKTSRHYRFQSDMPDHLLVMRIAEFDYIPYQMIPV